MLITGEIVDQGIIAVMVAKRPFRPPNAGGNFPAQGKLSFGNQGWV
jgi:hypothetical protein